MLNFFSYDKSKRLVGKRAHILEELAKYSLKRVSVELKDSLIRKRFELTHEILECIKRVDQDIEKIIEKNNDDITNANIIYKIMRDNGDEDFYKDLSNTTKYSFITHLVRILAKYIEFLNYINYFITREHPVSDVQIEKRISVLKEYRNYILSTINLNELEAPEDKE